MLRTIKFRLELVILGALILAGCSQAPTENIAPFETPTQEILQLVPMVDRDTPSVVPTRTPRRKPIVEGTITPTLTISQAVSTTSFHAFGQCQGRFDEQRISPKKGWYICEHGDPQGADILLIHVDGRRWGFSYREEYGIDYSGDIRYFKWTPDEAYLYFAVMEPWEMYGPFTANADALFRMDLSDGSILKILGTVDTFQPGHDFYIVSISPTGRRLAYSSDGEKPSLKLHVMDLQRGTETQIPMETHYDQMGNFTWSQDGLKLAYKIYSISDDVCKYSSSVGLLDLESMSAVTFIQDQPVDTCGGDQGIYEIVSVSEGSVLLEVKGEKWIYEIENQKFHKMN